MSKRQILPVVGLAAVVALPLAGRGEESARYVKTPTGYLMVLRQGDDVLASLEKLAAEEKIPSASISGIGFLKDVTFGFYHFGKKQFQPKDFHDVEMAGMTGSIAWKDGKPSVHAHASVAGPDFQAVGGHILAAKVGTGSAEITVIAHDKKLERKVDPGLGVNVLQLE
jgi:predicted DNA-binding protein with PD1-like motif